MQASKRLGRSPMDVAVERFSIDAEGRVLTAAGNS
jgi:hypothetical protein